MSITPSVLVEQAWTRFQEMSNTWVERSALQIDLLGYLGTPPTIAWETPPSIEVDLSTFVRPVAPVAPTVPAVAVTLPTAPELSSVSVADADPVPTEPDFSGLGYVKPDAPTQAFPTRPTDLDVSLADVVVPDAPAYTMPAEPSLYTLDLPTLPDLTLPTFDGVRPDTIVDLPQQTFAWQYQQYDLTLVNSIKSNLSGMMLNGLALPPAVEAAIFDRARGREDVLTNQAVQDGLSDLADRGIRQPAGLASRMLNRIRAEARQRASSASRDLSISIAQQNVEAVKFAIAQAISLEVAMVQANTQQNDLTLRAAQAQQAIVIDLFNARVALHNAQWEGYKADAQVFESRLRGLQAQVDAYRAQIEGQKAIGDVNESLVRAYGERMRALNVLADFYRSSIDAAKAKAEINTQKLEQVRLRLQAYGQDIDAWGKAWDGYKAQVQAELGNTQVYETLGNVYGKRVDAWRTKRQSDLEASRVALEVENQKLERYRALLTGAQIDSQVQLAAVDAVLRQYSTQGSVYAAEGQVAAAEAQAMDRNASLRIEQARLAVDTANSNNRLRADYALKAVDQAIETNRAKAQILAQLAAATLSGVNFGASISGSLGVSNSYSVGYSGDAENAPSWPLINNI